MQGEDHRDTLASANNLASVLRGLGDYGQARTLDEDTLTPASLADIDSGPQAPGPG